MSSSLMLPPEPCDHIVCQAYDQRNVLRACPVIPGMLYREKHDLDFWSFRHVVVDLVVF